MLDWLLYHDVLAKFSARHWVQRTRGQEECAEDDQIRKRAFSLPERSKVLFSTITRSNKLINNRLLA
jgi:hypothetical protein